MSQQAIPEKVLKSFEKIGKKPYEEQAQFFLNAYWDEHSGEAENIWDYCQKCIKINKGGHALAIRGKEGTPVLFHFNLIIPIISLARTRIGK